MNRLENPQSSQESKVDSPVHSIANATRAQATDAMNIDKAALDALNRSETFRFHSKNLSDLKPNSVRSWTGILNEMKTAIGESETVALLPQLKEWGKRNGIQNLGSALSKFNPRVYSEVNMDDPEQTKNAFDRLSANLSQVEKLEHDNQKLNGDIRKTGDLDLSQYIDENDANIRSLITPYQSTDEAKEALGNLRNALEDLGYQLED